MICNRCNKDFSEHMKALGQTIDEFIWFHNIAHLRDDAHKMRSVLEQIANPQSMNENSGFDFRNMARAVLKELK